MGNFNRAFKNGLGRFENVLRGFKSNFRGFNDVLGEFENVCNKSLYVTGKKNLSIAKQISPFIALVPGSGEFLQCVWFGNSLEGLENVLRWFISNFRGIRHHY